MHDEVRNKRRSNLFQRVVVGAVAGPFVFFSTVFSEFLFLVILLMIVVFTLREIYQLIRAAGENPLITIRWIYGLGIFAACILSDKQYH